MLLNKKLLFFWKFVGVFQEIQELEKVKFVQIHVTENSDFLCFSKYDKEIIHKFKIWLSR